MDVADDDFCVDIAFGSLDYPTRNLLEHMLDGGFFPRQSNPIVRHTVLRKRLRLEEEGLIERVGVTMHPQAGGGYQGPAFVGLGLMTNHAFDLAYKAAEDFTEELGKRTKAAGFMKSLLLQRICSSFASGRSTAEKMLQLAL